MKTPKIIIVGQKGELEPKKPMQLIHILLSDGTFDNIEDDNPKDFSFIELIARNYGTFANRSFDLIFCYDDPDLRSAGCFYLGYWNDGIVDGDIVE